MEKIRKTTREKHQNKEWGELTIGKINTPRIADAFVAMANVKEAPDVIEAVRHIDFEEILNPYCPVCEENELEKGKKYCSRECFYNRNK